MGYRDETDPLKAKESALASELASLRRREKDVTRALDEARATLRNERTLPMLEDVRVASPCSASWDDMIGDARVRFCGKCAKNVYNLSEMTRDEGEALLAKTEANICVRLYKRADGTVLTADCPVGVKRKRVRRVAAVAVAALGAGAAAGAALAAARPTMGECPIPQGRPTMGAVVVPDSDPAPSATPAPAAPTAPTVHVVQGRRHSPAAAPPSQPHRPHVLQGSPRRPDDTLNRSL